MNLNTYFKLRIRCNETRSEEAPQRSLLFLMTYLDLHSKQIVKPRFAVLIGIAYFYIDTIRCLPVLQGSSTRGTRATSWFCVSRDRVIQSPKIPTNVYLFFYKKSG
jgi:hypothetical protein